MTIATGAEDPTAIAFLGVWLGVENARAYQVRRVELSVLCVNVEDGTSKHADGRDRIDVLPEEMTGIVVAADSFSCDRAETQHGLGVIHHEAGMHLNGNFHTMVRGEFRVLDPIGRNHLVPLPVENFAVVRRPWAGDPVGGGSIRGIARTSGKVNDHRNAEF